MRDIAREAKVSQSTVSRALRNDPQISAVVREKVRQVAERLEYRPNPFIAAFTAQLRTHRKTPLMPSIAFLDTLPVGVSRIAYSGAYEEGARKRAADLGFHVDTLRLAELDHSRQTLNRILRARATAGLLVLPVLENVDLREVDFSHLASSTVDPSLQEPALHRASPDYFQGMLVALAALRARGYRRIAFTTNQSEIQRIGARWLGAFLYEKSITGGRDQIEPFVQCGWERAEFSAWLEQARPDAIVSNLSLHFRWLMEMGVRMPEDLGFARLNAGDGSGASGIDQRGEQVGAAAVDLIIGQIHRNEYGIPAEPKSVSVKNQWIDGTRPTVRPVD